MKDIKISNNTLAFKNGDWEILNQANRVLQNIKVALKTFKNDWFLDYTKGVNYFDYLKSNHLILLKADIKKAIREVVGVSSITKFNFTRQSDKIYIEVSVLIDESQYTITEGFNIWQK